MGAGQGPGFPTSTALPPPLRPSLGGLSLFSKRPLIGAGFSSFLLLRAKHTPPRQSLGREDHTQTVDHRGSFTTPQPIAWPGTRPSQHPPHGRGLASWGWGGAARRCRGKGWGQWVRVLALTPPCDLKQAADVSEPSPFCEGVTGLVPNPALEHPWPRSRRDRGASTLRDWVWTFHLKHRGPVFIWLSDPLMFAFF